MAQPWEQDAILVRPGGQNRPPWETDARVVKPASTEPNVAKDVALSVPSGLVRGAAETAMTPVTLHRLAESGADWLFNKADAGIRHLVGAAPADENQRAELRKKLDDPLSSALYAGQDAVRKTEDAVLHKPETTAGKYAQTVAEFLPGGALGKSSVMQKLIGNTAIPGLTSEAAGQYAEHNKMSPVVETIMRLVGGGLGNLGVAGARAIHSAPEAIARRSMPELPAETWDKAKQLQELSHDVGPSLSGPEAVQAASENATKLGSSLAAVEQSVGGGAKTAEFFAKRSEQVKKAFGQAMDTIAEKARPETLGPRASATAEAALGDVRRGINDATRPLYKAAEGVTVDANLGHAFEESLRRLRSDPVLGPKYAYLPDNSVGVIDAVTKDMYARAESLGNAAHPGYQPQAAAVYGGDAGLAREVARGASPEYETALAAQEQARRQNLNPLEQGPLGAIAKVPPESTGGAMSSTQKVAEALLPHTPDKHSEGGVAAAVSAMASRDPKTTAQVVRQALENRFDATTRALRSGENQWLGANFRRDAAGTDQQRENLAAALGKLPVAPQPVKPLALDDFLKVAEATGHRDAVGSPTAMRTRQNRDLGHEPGIGPLLHPKQTIQDFWHDLHSSRLADLYLAPDSVTRLHGIQVRGAETPLRDVLLRQLFQTPLEVRR